MRSPWKYAVLASFLALGLAFAACGDASDRTTDSGSSPADEKPVDAQPDAGGPAVADGSVADSTDLAAGSTGLAAGSGDSGVMGDPAAAGACCKKDGASGACCKEGGKCSGDCKEGGACCKKDADAPACLCEQGKAGQPVWCDKCDKGFVDGKEVCCSSCVKKAQAKQKADAGQ